LLEIPVRTQHHELIPDAESGEERIDRADLKAAAATVVAKIRRGNVIFALWDDQRQRSESIEDLLSRFRAAESLQDLLENQACSKDRSFVLKSICQELHAGMAISLITAQCKRPDTGINEEPQFRDRAAL
jgi:transposase